MHSHLTVFSHPLISTKLAQLKDRNSSKRIFRKALNEICVLMIPTIFANTKTQLITIQTPLAEQKLPVISEEVIILPILRAGLGMVHAFTQLLPESKLGFAGYRRNEKTLQAEKYHFTMPKITANSLIVILDPMIATGNTVFAVLKELEANNSVPFRVKLVGVLATKKALTRLKKTHSKIEIYLAKAPEELNLKGFITPGLGDAGDRLFGD